MGTVFNVKQSWIHWTQICRNETLFIITFYICIAILIELHWNSGFTSSEKLQQYQLESIETIGLKTSVCKNGLKFTFECVKHVFKMEKNMQFDEKWDRICCFFVISFLATTDNVSLQPTSGRRKWITYHSGLTHVNLE